MHGQNLWILMRKSGRILFDMKKILVGISGASGAPIAIRLLKRLREMADVETYDAEYWKAKGWTGKIRPWK